MSRASSIVYILRFVLRFAVAVECSFPGYTQSLVWSPDRSHRSCRARDCGNPRRKGAHLTTSEEVGIYHISSRCTCGQSCRQVRLTLETGKLLRKSFHVAIGSCRSISEWLLRVILCCSRMTGETYAIEHSFPHVRRSLGIRSRTNLPVSSRASSAPAPQLCKLCLG